MKGNDQILQTLNDMLVDELTAINQYIVHSEMCANWGFDRLHDAIEKRAIEEMKHAEMLIERILYLEGSPIVTRLQSIHIGAEVVDQFQNDYAFEQNTVKAYNAAVLQAASLSDNGSRVLFETILKDEEEHIDWLEAQLDQVRQMGIQNYLTKQFS